MFNRSWFVPLLLGSLMACTPLIASRSNPVQSATQDTPTSQPSTPTAPAKTTTIQVNGKPQTVPINFVQTSRFSTYFPTDRFTLEQDKNNSGIRLYWENPDGTIDRKSFIAFTFYEKNTRLSEVRELVDVDAQIFETRGARRITQSPAIAEAKRTYSTWLRDVIRVEDSLPNDSRKSVSATAYLGEVKGQVFVVFSVRRFQDEDEFTAREAVILKNLKVKNGNK